MSEFSITSIAQLGKQADELSNLNAQFNSKVNALRETENTLKAQWEGDASTAFHQAFSQDLEQMNNYYNAITTYAGALQQIAASYQQAESANLEIAKTRSY